MKKWRKPVIEILTNKMLNEYIKASARSCLLRYHR